MSAVRSHWLPALVGLVIAVFVLNIFDHGSRFFAKWQPAIEWQYGEAVNYVVMPRGILEIEYQAWVRKQCPSDLQSFLVADDNSVPVRFPVVKGGYTAPTDTYVPIRVKVAIPEFADPGLAPLEPGPYIYRTVATRYCPEGIQYDNAIPDVTFVLASRE